MIFDYKNVYDPIPGWYTQVDIDDTQTQVQLSWQRNNEPVDIQDAYEFLLFNGPSV